MKKVVFNNLVIAALVVAAAFTSCNGGGVKLLDTVISRDGSLVKYEYDNYYEYDRAGFPIQWTLIFNGSIEDVVELKYK